MVKTKMNENENSTEKHKSKNNDDITNITTKNTFKNKKY